MRNTLFAVSAVAAIAAGSSSATAAPLEIDFDFGTVMGGGTFAPVNSTPAPGITVSDLFAGSGAGVTLNTMPSGTSSGYNTTAPVITVSSLTAVNNNLNNAEAANVFFAFTITADAGVSFDLDDLSLNVGRSANSSTRGWGFYTDVTGFVDPLASDTASATRGDGALDLDTAALTGLDDLTGTVEVRFYVFTGTGGSANPGRTVDFDNISLVGTTVVPEPTAAGLILGGGLLTLARRRRS